MNLFITIIHVMTCVLLILVVLLQSGKGAEISASFGGSSQTVFGSSGGANFFTRLTATLAGIFMLTSILLTYFAKENSRSRFDDVPVSAIPAQEAAPLDPTQPGTEAVTTPEKPAPEGVAKKPAAPKATAKAPKKPAEKTQAPRPSP